MMDNKLSELSKPVSWADERGNLCTNTIKERGLDSKYRQDYEKYSTPLYSQEYVSALLADNEAKDKRIAELERANTSQDDHINQQQDRIESLEKTNTGLGQRLGAAEKLLDTPVDINLPERRDDSYDWDGASPSDAFNTCRSICGLMFRQQLRAAGFTVEGDE